MKIKALKFTKKTAIAIILAFSVLLAGVVLAVSKTPAEDVGTTEGRVAYLSALGWEVDPATELSEVIILPRVFDGVMLTYNRMQQAQGFDLSLYAGRECTRYIYKVINYPNSDDTVLAQLFICGNRVVGGDIHSTALDGFMHGLK
jgi:hypothetical protein